MPIYKFKDSLFRTTSEETGLVADGGVGEESSQVLVHKMLKNAIGFQGIFIMGRTPPFVPWAGSLRLRKRLTSTKGKQSLEAVANLS